MNTAPRFAWAPDYPWGMRQEKLERTLAEMEQGWGTRAYAERDAPWPMPGMTREEVVDWELEWMHLSASRGDAIALTRMFYESDVRDVLGTIRVPTLVLSRGGGAMEEEARAFAALIPGARRQTMPGTQPTVMQEHPEAYAEAIEVFAHELREEEAQLDSVLATVLFTDIVGSTARQSELGDRRWAELVEEHHAVVRGCLARYRGRELDTAGDGFFAAFDGPATRDPLRAGDRRGRAARSGSRCGPGCTPASAGRRRQDRGPRRLDRRARERARGARPRCLSRRPCATSWPVRASSSPTAASTS